MLSNSVTCYIRTSFCIVSCFSDGSSKGSSGFSVGTMMLILRTGLLSDGFRPERFPSRFSAVLRCYFVHRRFYHLGRLYSEHRFFFRNLVYFFLSVATCCCYFINFFQHRCLFFFSSNISLSVSLDFTLLTVRSSYKFIT